MMSRIHLTPRMAGTVLAAGLVFSWIVLATFGLPYEAVYAPHRLAGAHSHHVSAEAAEAPHGFTAGWLDGQTVQFFYTKDFFCQPPPTSGAPSQCEGMTNEQDQRLPRGRLLPMRPNETWCSIGGKTWGAT